MSKAPSKFGKWKVSPLGDYGYRDVIIPKGIWDKAVRGLSGMGRKSLTGSRATAKQPKAFKR